MKIHILGASGSGTTTLGRELGKSGWHHLDADDYYWVKTNPPFQQKVALDVRNQNISRDFEAQDDVVISGSMFSWGNHWKKAFDLVVFIRIDPGLRMDRLRAREEARYGRIIYEDKERNKAFRAFINWAEQYDDPGFTGRSLRLHEEWISELSCPVLRLDGAARLEHNVKRVLDQVHSLQTSPGN